MESNLTFSHIKKILNANAKNPNTETAKYQKKRERNISSTFRGTWRNPILEMTHLRPRYHGRLHVYLL